MTDHSHSSPAPDARHIVVDAEHFTVRFLVPVMAIGLAIGFHLLVNALLRSTLKDQGVAPDCVLFPGDIIVFLGGAFLTERILKRVSPSRRHAILDSSALTLVDRRPKPHKTTIIDWDKTVNAQAWHFEVTRRSRVPKGWHCMAIQLLQDEEDIIVYAFMSLRDAEDLHRFERFSRLRPRKEIEGNTDLHTVAHQRRLLKLEDRRWEDGAEISQDDLRAIIERMAQVIPGWE